MLKRFTAGSTAFLFCLSLMAPPCVQGAESPASAFRIENPAVPDSLGHVESLSSGTRPGALILLQDAHEAASAQKSLWQLIEYFQKEAGVESVYLEGASGELDPLLLKTFPNRNLLQKVLEEYLEASELPGSIAAAVLSPNPGRFEGVEKWALYEEGVHLFLKAQSDRQALRADFSRRRENLEKQKAAVYSPELLGLDQKLETFADGSSSLLEVLEALAGFKAPPPGSEIEALLAAAHRKPGDSAGAEALLRQWSDDLRKALLKRSDRETAGSARLFEERCQQYQTSGMDAAAFAHFLQDFSVKLHLDVSAPEGAGHWIRSGKRLAEIKGAQIFQDLESYTAEVKQVLIGADEKAKALDRENRRLNLLEKLAALELSSKDWEELNRGIPEFNPEEEGLWNSLAHAKRFYGNARERDQVFYRRVKADLEKGRAAVLVAGGFHTENLLRAARGDGFSVLLVTPVISGLPEEGLYERHMNGGVSWSAYLKEADGKIPLYEAFHRAVRDRLLAEAERNREALLSEWQDNLVRELSRQNRAREISDYARLLQETGLEDSSAGYRMAWENNIRRFVDGLRRLKDSGDLKGPKIQQLLEPSAIPSRTVLAGNLVRGSAIRVSALRTERLSRGAWVRESKRQPGAVLPRSELRSDSENLESFPRVLIGVPQTPDDFYEYAAIAADEIRLRVEGYLGTDKNNTRQRILDEILPSVQEEIRRRGDIQKIADGLSLAVRSFPAPPKQAGDTVKRVKAVLGNIGRSVQSGKRNVLRAELRSEEMPLPPIAELDAAGRNTVWMLEESEDYLLGQGERAVYYLGSYEGRPAAFGVAKVNPEAYMLQRPVLEKFLGSPDLPQLRAVIPDSSILVFEPLPPGGAVMTDAVGVMNEWSLVQRASVLRRISETYLVLAQKGVLHRDLKPDNIYLPPEIFKNTSWTEEDLKNHPPIIFDFELSMLFQPGTNKPAASHQAQYELEVQKGMEAVTQTYAPYSDDILKTALEKADMREGSKVFQHNPHMDLFAFGVMTAWMFGRDVTGMQAQQKLDEDIVNSHLPDPLKTFLKELLDKDLVVADAAEAWARVIQEIQRIEEYYGAEFVEAEPASLDDTDFQIGPAVNAPTREMTIVDHEYDPTIQLGSAYQESNFKLDPALEARLAEYTDKALALTKEMETGGAEDVSRVSRELVKLTRETWSEDDLVSQEGKIRHWLEKRLGGSNQLLTGERYYDVSGRAAELNHRILMMLGFDKPEGLTRIYLGGDGVNEMAFETDLEHAAVYPMNRYRFLSDEEYPLSEELMKMTNLPIEDDTGKFVDRPDPLKRSALIVKEILSKGIVYTVTRKILAAAAAEDTTPVYKLEQRNPALFYANLSRLFDREMSEGTFQKELADEILKKINRPRDEKTPEGEALLRFYTSQLKVLEERNVFALKAREIYEDFRRLFPGSGPFQFVDIGVQGAQQFFIASAVLHFEKEKAPLFYQRIGAHSGAVLASYQFTDITDADDMAALEHYRLFYYAPEDSLKARQPVFRQAPAESLIATLQLFMMAQHEVKQRQKVEEIARFVRDFSDKGFVMVDMDGTLTHHPQTLEMEPRTTDEIVRLLVRGVPVVVNTLNSADEMRRRVFYPVLSRLEEVGRADAIQHLGGYGRVASEYVDREDGRTPMIFVVMSPEGVPTYHPLEGRMNKAETTRHFQNHTGRKKFVFLDDQFGPGGYARFALDVEGGYFLDIENSRNRTSERAVKDRGAVNLTGTQKWLRLINYAIDTQPGNRSELREAAPEALYSIGDMKEVAERLAPDAAFRGPVNSGAVDRLAQAENLTDVETGLLSAMLDLESRRDAEVKSAAARIQASSAAVDQALARAYQRLQSKFPDRRVNLALDLPLEKDGAWTADLEAALKNSAGWIDRLTLSSSEALEGEFHIAESLVRVFQNAGIKGIQPDARLERAEKLRDISGQKKLGLVALSGNSKIVSGKNWVWAIEHSGDLTKLNALERAALLKLKVFLALAVALEEDLLPAELLREYGLESLFGGASFDLSQNRIGIMLEAFHTFMLSEQSIAASA